VPQILSISKIKSTKLIRELLNLRSIIRKSINNVLMIVCLDMT